MAAPLTLLFDNGSLAPAATLQLRRIARALAGRVGEPVGPVSLLHASGVAAADLEGVPAEILEPAIDRRAQEGARDFLLVPLFFGPSRALTDYVPERLAALHRRWPDLRVRLAPTLFQAEDDRLGEILSDHVRAVEPNPTRVVLVDHGSPVRVVTAVRDALTGQLQRRLGPGVTVAGACMERRPGSEYDFNGPLLADLLARDGWNSTRVTVAMQFLLPGRHAGADGDVAEICRAAAARCPALTTQLTPLVGEHPRLTEILADRWRAGLRAEPLR
jgi:sirohydrochlorin ferrochelatase